MSHLSDLARDSKLETRFHGKYTRHRFIESDPIQGARDVVREEYWTREKLVGSGAFGRVWCERCVKGAKDYNIRAVKEIIKPPSYGKRVDYSRELEAIAKFSHERYVRCFVKSFGWYEDEHSLYITMEYLPQRDLQVHMSSSPPLTEVDARNVVYQLLEGISFLHENGFAHRDIKPSNVLIKSKPPEPWWVKICDFGISKRTGDITGGSSTLKGTLGYIPPELHGFLENEDCFSERSHAASCAADIWSLGEIAFQLLTKSASFPKLGTLMTYVRDPNLFPYTTLQQYTVSQTGIEFLVTTMDARPKHRATADQAIRHPWIATGRKPSSKASSLISLSSLDLNDDLLSSDQLKDTEPSGRWSPVTLGSDPSQGVRHNRTTSRIPGTVYANEDPDMSRYTAETNAAARATNLPTVTVNRHDATSPESGPYKSHTKSLRKREKKLSFENPTTHSSGGTSKLRLRHVTSDASGITIDSNRIHAIVVPDQASRVFTPQITQSRSHQSAEGFYSDVESTSSKSVLEQVPLIYNQKSLAARLANAPFTVMTDGSGRVQDADGNIAGSVSGNGERIRLNGKNVKPVITSTGLSFVELHSLEYNDVASSVTKTDGNERTEKHQGRLQATSMNTEDIRTVRLFRGNLVLDIPQTEEYLESIPHCPPPDRDEFTHWRFTAVTCKPDEFQEERYTLRPTLFFMQRRIELLVAVHIETWPRPEALAPFLQDIFDTFLRFHMEKDFVKVTQPQAPWKSIYMVFVAPTPQDPRIVEMLDICGIHLKWQHETGHPVAIDWVDDSGTTTKGRFEFGPNSSVRGVSVKAELYEYTSQKSVRVRPDADLTQVPVISSPPVQMLFCCPKSWHLPAADTSEWTRAIAECLDTRLCVSYSLDQPASLRISDSLLTTWRTEKTSHLRTTFAMPVYPKQKSGTFSTRIARLGRWRSQDEKDV